MEQKKTTQELELDGLWWSSALGRYVSEEEIDQTLAKIPVLPCLEIVVIENDFSPERMNS